TGVVEATGAEIPEQIGTAERPLPEVSDATSVTGSGIRAIAQFATGFIPAIKAVRAVSAGGMALSGLAGLAQMEAAAALGSALVFDPHEERLSNMVEQVPELSNPVTRYLAAKEDDTAAEGR